MGDEFASGGMSKVHFAPINNDGTTGEFRELGEVIEFRFDTDAQDDWSDTLLKLTNEPIVGSLSFKLPWYWSWRHLRKLELPFGDELIWRMVASKPYYMIRDLRRGGKSHKGKGKRS